jgi:hypothetical protein
MAGTIAYAAAGRRKNSHRAPVRRLVDTARLDLHCQPNGGSDMGTAHQVRIAVIAGVVAAGLGAFGAAQARELPADFVLSCDNGQSYPIRARAVSASGDLVTGYVWTGRGRAHHIRLVPMGVGYRYAAAGLWIDGWRQEAELNFGLHKSVSCTVTHD